MHASTLALTEALADRYRVDREIGQGGMATVYLARDLRHDRDVAIKVLFPDLAAALGGERFLTEIKTTAKLQHPHILPLLDSGDASGLLYYVMPLVTGETLRTRLDREKLLPIDEALRIAREVADALAHAHHLGIIHRDIKPENILLQEGHALVADFGIALAVQQSGGQRMTQTGLSLGTPQYMSPEQAMGERHIDARADIYALGAVTYEMLVGDPPFTGSTVQAIVAKVMTERPSRIVTQRDRVPANVEAAVMCALEKLPADRWGTAREFEQALRDGALATNASITAVGVAPAPSPKRRSIRIAGVAALVVGGVAAGYFVGRGRNAGDAQPVISSIIPPAGGSFGEKRALALTRDGRHLAFSFAAADGSTLLMVRDVTTGVAQPINGSVGAYAPFWSPDGKTLAFFANGYLTILDQKAVGPRRSCPVTEPAGGSWSDDGTIIFAHREGIVTVPATGGNCTTIVPANGATVANPVFVPGSRRFMWVKNGQVIYSEPDGRVIAEMTLRFTLAIAIPQPAELVYASLRDSGSMMLQRFDTRSGKPEGAPERIVRNVRTNEAIGTFAASATGDLIFLSGSDDKPYFEYDAGGALRDTIRIQQQWSGSPRPRRAGSPMVVLAGFGAGAWTYDFASRRATPLNLKDPISAKLGQIPNVAWPVFSPDGSRVAYMSSNSEGCAVAERDLAKGTERMISQPAKHLLLQCKAPRDWSSDGEWLLVRTDSVLETIDMNGKVGTRIARPGTIFDASFSPDGRAVAFSSTETGRAEIYVQTLPSGTPARASNEGGRHPFWTSDGKRLIYITPDGRVQEIAMNGTVPQGTPRTRFTVPTWRRAMFDDIGTAFVMVGEAERFVLRQATADDALTFVQHWPSLLKPR